MEMVAEGYYGTKAIWLANQDVQVDLPIVEAVYQILYNRRSAKAVIKELTKKFQ
jgi:glycerol-3-phosphate dehydrogenase (NAD(P)+)